MKVEVTASQRKPEAKNLSGSKTKRKSIKRRLLVGIISLSVIITLCCGVASSFILYRESSNNMNTRLTESARAYSQAVENAIEVYKTRIEAVATNSSITSVLKTQADRDAIMAQLAEKNEFATLSTVNSKGQTSDGVEVGDREYFQRAMEGETYISTTLVSVKTGETMLMIAAKMDNGGYNGVALATISGDTFSSMLDDVSIGQSGYAFIVDKDGKIIAHRNRETVAAQTNYIELVKDDDAYADVAEQIEHMIMGESGTRTISFQGKTLVGSYMPIENTDGWSIGVCALESELLDSYYTSIWIMLGLMILFISISVWISFRISKPIVLPIVSLVQRIEALSDGDLHSDVPKIESQDEIGILSSSFAKTIDTLKAYIGEIAHILKNLEQGDCTVRTNQEYTGDFITIRDSLYGIITNLNAVFTNIQSASGQVATGAGQVSGAAQALASGAAEQAATVEELNASIETVTQQAEQNAVSTRKATEYVEQSARELSRSNEYMRQLNTSMAEIGEASQQISKITKLVEDIAFQTNILSLNAAVEAARAGDAGKGFAVVADEVRTLAIKSSDAAKQTAKLIQKSVVTVSEGERLASETLKALGNVSEKSRLVEQAIREIESSSSEQASSIEQINQGLSQVSAVVQTNAATAEESSASSEELSSQAQALQMEVAKFKLSEIRETQSEFSDYAD